MKQKLFGLVLAVVFVAAGAATHHTLIDLPRIEALEKSLAAKDAEIEKWRRGARASVEVADDLAETAWELHRSAMKRVELLNDEHAQQREDDWLDHQIELRKQAIKSIDEKMELLNEIEKLYEQLAPPDLVPLDRDRELTL